MRLLLALACCLGAAAWLASGAAACHSEITATLDCAGKISYTATAWNDSTATTAGRTNSNVAVWVTINGQTQTATGHFGPDNGFSFSGTFSAGSAQSATVYVQEKANWGTGDAPEAARSATVTRPTNCGSGTPPPPPPGTPPVQNTAPTAPAPPASISVVKLERVGTTGGFGAGPVDAVVGQTVYYQIVVTNSGPAVTLSAADPGCTGLAPTGPQALETGKSLTFTCSHTIVAGDIPSYTNVATATATSANGKPVTATSNVVANVATGGVLGVTAQKKPATVHQHVKAKKVKKVTKVAKPARAVVRKASFTG
jgi:hypothetical protein